MRQLEIEHPADRMMREKDEARAEQAAKLLRDRALADAYRAVAATPAGRTVLAEWVNDYTAAMAAVEFKGNSKDCYHMGRAAQAERIREKLRAMLPREMYLEIIYPQGEQNNG